MGRFRFAKAYLDARCAPVLVVLTVFPWLESFFSGSNFKPSRMVKERVTPEVFFFFCSVVAFDLFLCFSFVDADRDRFTDAIAQVAYEVSTYFFSRFLEITRPLKSFTQYFHIILLHHQKASRNH